MRAPKVKVARISRRGPAVAVKTADGWCADPDTLTAALADYLFGRTNSAPTIRLGKGAS